MKNNLKRRLILHLGLSKTGTTSIQKFLRDHAGILSNHGILYPDLVGERSSHSALAPSVLKNDAGREVHHLALAMELRQGRGAPAGERIDTPLWSGVFERIEESDAHTIIISYENFYIRPDLYRFDALAPHLKNFEVQGIIYLRPQEDWLVALYGQLVRGVTRVTVSFADFMKSQHAHLVYSEILDNIKKYIPLDGLVISDFEKASGSGLLSDFFENIGLPRDIPPPVGDHLLANRSPPHWVTLFLLKCNQARITDQTFVKVRGALTHGSALNKAPPLRPGLDVARPAEREAVRAAAAADANRLRERYGLTLTGGNREAVVYRSFDDEDVKAIRSALLPRSVLEELGEI